MAILGEKDVAEVLVGLDVMRVNPDRLAARCLGLVQSVRLGLDDPQAAVAVNVGRVQCQSVAEDGFGLVVSFGRRQGKTK